MSAWPDLIRRKINQVDVEFNLPVESGYHKMLTQSLTDDEGILKEEARKYDQEPEKENEYMRIVKVYLNAKTLQAHERYQGKFFLEPRTKTFYLNATFTFDSFERAKKFAEVIRCECFITVYVEMVVNPELMDLKSLYLDEQAQHTREQYKNIKDKKSDEANYLERLSFYFDAAICCLAERVYTEKCYATEEGLFMLFGFRFASIEYAEDFSLAVKSYD